VAYRSVIYIVVSCLFRFFPNHSTKTQGVFNQGWKFIKSDPGGTTAANTSYSDASWATVNIPHSPSYDTTNYAGEHSAYIGTCWYRKTFTVPSVAKKVFIEFEAATQIADLWLNGTFYRVALQQRIYILLFRHNQPG
jgi:hypothetical protein